MSDFILTLDSGTHSIRARIYDKKGVSIASGKEELSQVSPQSGWVEHDAMQIWAIQISLAQMIMKQNDINAKDIAAIGVANQRESVVLWEKSTGRPVYNTIVWQDRRTVALCDQLLKDGVSEEIQKTTGLIIDPYFSASKIQWILDEVPGLRMRAENGEILFGTIDTWLVWNLTRGELHITDYSNASRTMLFNIKTLEWDESMLRIFRIPACILPLPRRTSELHGNTHFSVFGGVEIPIACIVADQQASLFGNNCLEKGDIKNSYGIGSFIMMHTGSERFTSNAGMLTTIAWGLKDKVEYAQEGSVFVSGLAIQWIRDHLRLIHTSDDSEYFASRVEDSGGVYFVPAFHGLGAPHWSMHARGVFVGITQDSNVYHFVRATLDALCYQCKDVVDAIEADTGIIAKDMRVDGGAAENSFMLQLQSDILGLPVLRPRNLDTTSLGVAWLAGLAVDMWNIKDINLMYKVQQTFQPSLRDSLRTQGYAGWKEAISLAKYWGEHRASQQTK